MSDDINARIVDGAVVIELFDAMKPGFGDEVAEVVSRFVDQGHRRFVLDFSRVPVLDSAGLGGVVRAFTLVSRRGGTVRCTGSNAQLEHELRLIGLP